MRACASRRVSFRPRCRCISSTTGRSRFCSTVAVPSELPMTRPTVRARVCVALGVLCASLGVSVPAGAQQRPLITEDPEPIGAGRVLVEAGMDYGTDQFFPASGLLGNLLRLPVIGISFGVSSIAELQIDSGYAHLNITDRV